MNVPERYWTWTATGDGGQPQPVVSAFAGSNAALDALEVEAGPERWLDSLERLRGDLDLDRDGALLSTWADDPWVARRVLHLPTGVGGRGGRGAHRPARIRRRAHRRALRRADGGRYPERAARRPLADAPATRVTSA